MAIHGKRDESRFSRLGSRPPLAYEAKPQSLQLAFSWLRFIATLDRRRAIQKAGASNRKGRPAESPAASVLHHPTPTRRDAFNTGDVAAERDINPVSLSRTLVNSGCSQGQQEPVHRLPCKGHCFGFTLFRWRNHYQGELNKVVFDHHESADSQH